MFFAMLEWNWHSGSEEDENVDNFTNRQTLSFSGAKYLSVM